MFRKPIPVFFLISFCASAQVPPDSSRVLEEVFIQSNRIQPGFNEFSASVIIITQQQIQNSPALSVPDLLHYYAGVDIRQRGANGVQADAGIRGSTFDQVLILINGIKISDPQTGHHSLNLPVDIDNIARIEVLKGPAARVFGQNAFAGAINIITKTPDETAVKVSALGGDFGLGGWRLTASVNTGSNKHYLSTSRDFSDGYKYNTDYKLTNYFYQGEWNGTRGTFNLLAGYTDRSFGANGFYASPAFQDQFETIQTSLVALGYAAKPTERSSIKQRLYWRRNQDEYLFIRNNPPAYRNLHVGNIAGYEINMTRAGKNGITGLGADINHQTLSSNNLGQRDRTVATLFAEHRWEWNHWDLTPGVQVNYYSDFGTNLFPGVDVGYRISQSIKAFGNWGYTYRVPTYTDLYYSDPANEGNPSLKPEYAVSYEMGLKLMEIKWLQGQVSYFRRNGHRIIDWTKTNPSDKWRPDNLIGVNMEGLDASISIRPIKRINLDIGYVFIQADKVSDLALSRYALENLNHQLVTTVAIAFSPDVQLTVSYRYSDRENLPDYSVTDSRLIWRRKNVSAFIDVTNIFDETYRETNLVTMPGRWAKAGLAVQFGKPE